MGKGWWLAAPSADQGTWVGTLGVLSLGVRVSITAQSPSSGWQVRSVRRRCPCRLFCTEVFRVMWLRDRMLQG